MEDGQKQIEFVLDGEIDGIRVTPSTIGLSRFNEFNRQAEDFVGGSKRPKLDDVRVSVGEGSYKLTVVLTAALLALLEPDLQALQRPDSLGEIDPKRAEVVSKWQARAKERPGLRYAIRPVGLGTGPIELDVATDYRVGETEPWVKVEKYLFGTVMDMGGANKANVHIRTDESGELLIVGSDQEYLRSQDENHLYRKVLLRVQAEQHHRTGQLRRLRLLSFESYQPGYDPAALDRFAEAGRIAWRDVPDAAEWVRRLRGGN